MCRQEYLHDPAPHARNPCLVMLSAAAFRNVAADPISPSVIPSCHLVFEEVRTPLVFFSPFAIVIFFLFLFGLLLLFALIHVGLMTVAFEKIGLGPGQVFAFLLLSLLGSHINIPIKRLRQTHVMDTTVVRFFGMRYRIPATRFPGTVVAVNVGGALVPLLLSAYLMLKWHLIFSPLLCTGIVASAAYYLARPIRGVGIALPLFVPPFLAALVALLFATEGHAPVVAYVAGTMGTLLGADLMHLKDVARLEAPVVSVGGAGTFDGIFLTGIIAVLLA